MNSPDDPWQETFSMRNLELGRLCTYTTTSWGGRKAFGTLLKAYARDQRGKKHPGMMPVVTLSSKTEPSMDYGDVDKPVLTIGDWQNFG
jgi:hypothetical protein